VIYLQTFRSVFLFLRLFLLMGNEDWVELLFDSHTVEFQSDGCTYSDWQTALKSDTSEERSQVILCE
jgi:hypothetical protein